MDGAAGLAGWTDHSANILATAGFEPPTMRLEDNAATTMLRYDNVENTMTIGVLTRAGTARLVTMP